MPITPHSVVKYQTNLPNFAWANLVGTSVTSITKPGTPVSEGIWMGQVFENGDEAGMMKIRLFDGYFGSKSATYNVRDGLTLTNVLGGFTIVLGTLVAGDTFKIEWHSLVLGVQP